MTVVTAASKQASVVHEPPQERQGPPFSAGAPGFAAFELGLRMLAEASELDGSVTSQHVVALLFRSALISFLSARKQRNAEPPPRPVELWAAIEQLLELDVARSALDSKQVPLIVAALTSEIPELQVLALSAEDREQTTRGLRALALVLGEQLAEEARGSRHRRVTRLKIVALALCCALPLGWYLSRAPNLALHRPVEVSSRSAQFGVDPGSVVDGKRVNLGFHTEDKGPHTVTVDLGTARRIHRVDVFNRADCCQERAIPLNLQVSADGRSFRTLLVRIDPFSLWKAEFPATEARYVRLSQSGDGPFHLSEIEIY